MISQTVQELSCWETHVLANGRYWKQPSFQWCHGLDGN